MGERFLLSGVLVFTCRHASLLIVFEGEGEVCPEVSSSGFFRILCAVLAARENLPEAPAGSGLGRLMPSLEPGLFGVHLF